ncbi:MAG: TonB-dependent receptor plug domain-containing protein [Saprospiraceae bacterium]
MAHYTTLFVRLQAICLLLAMSSLTTLDAKTIQVSIQGYVKNVHGFPEEGALIYIEGTFDETTSDSSGYFHFSTEAAIGSSIMLIAHKNDYLDAFEPLVVSASTLKIEVVFAQKIYELEAVTVTAKKTMEKEFMQVQSIQSLEAILSSSDGNLLSSLNTLPGAQQVGETGELSVRGGAGHETSFFVDGMLLRQYLSSSTPGTAGRMRFSADLFKSFQLNTGGYSAEYGQALSSILLMETKDLPMQFNEGFFVSPFFISSQTKSALNKTTTLESDMSYTNFALVSKLLKTDDPDKSLFKGPETIEGNAFLKKKLKGGGLFKTFLYGTHSRIGFADRDINHPDGQIRYNLTNDNIYSTSSFKKQINGWNLFTAVSMGYDREDIGIDSIAQKENLQYGQLFTGDKEWSGHVKARVTKQFGNSVLLNVGSESFYSDKTLTYRDQTAHLKELIWAAYAESSLRLSRKVNLSVGTRYEYSSLLEKSSFSPRLNLAVDLGGNYTFNMAGGNFYQTPQYRYLVANPSALKFQKATHAILGIEKQISRDQYLKFDVFHKKYKHLIQFDKELVKSTGHGYTRGFEILWRDEKSIRSLEYHVNYSFTDTKRAYLDYPIAAQPSFVSKHQGSLVIYKNFPKLSTLVGTSYTYQSGRPYFNPNRPAEEFLSDRTKDFHIAKINIAYSFNLRDHSAILVLSLDNILGTQQVYGYEYGVLDPSYRREISPLYRRFLFVGGFLNLGTSKDSKKMKELLKNR